MGHGPHTLTVHDRATIKGLIIHIMSITQRLLSGGSIQGSVLGFFWGEGSRARSGIGLSGFKVYQGLYSYKML